jgi:hypothetical protein
VVFAAFVAPSPRLLILRSALGRVPAWRPTVRVPNRLSSAGRGGAITATIHTPPSLIGVLIVIAIVARRFNTAPSILLVTAGVLLARTPELPHIDLAPELALLGSRQQEIAFAGTKITDAGRKALEK